MECTVNHAVEVLNRLLQTDQCTISRLIQHTVNCDCRLAADPTLQVDLASFTTSVLALLNALFGLTVCGRGRIVAIVNDYGTIEKFVADNGV